MSLNPQITTVEVGIKRLREVTIYPLSVADQFKMTELIGEVIQKVSDKSFAEQKDTAVVEFIVKALKKHLDKILCYVLDDSEKLEFTELSNTQLTEIINVIFEVNYEGMIKNLKDLSKKAKVLWTSEGSLPKSSEKPAID